MSERPIFLGDVPGGDGAAKEGAGLKRRAADALERALGFAEVHGDALAGICARVALRGEAPEVLAEQIEQAQRPDGGFAPFAAATAGWIGRELGGLALGDALRGSLEALGLLSDARLSHRRGAERAVRFVESQQRRDGSFGDGAAPEARLAVTAFAAGSLGRTLFARPEGLAAAGGFLEPLWSPERIEGGQFAELAGSCIYFTNVPDELSDEALQWCGRELERGFRSRRLEALTVMQVLLACRVGSIPGASFAPEELLARLLDEQAGDGGFDALCAAGAPARVGPTIDAMRAIIGLCAVF